MGQWYGAWKERQRKSTPFRPEGRKEGSDYNLHSVDIEASFSALDEEGRRSMEIQGRDPDTRRPLSEPDPAARFRGAVLAASAGDAFAQGIHLGAVRKVSWEPAPRFVTSTGARSRTGRDEFLFEYQFGASVPSSALFQLSAFTLEGVIRAHVARRMNPADDDPVQEVRHAYQRWLHTRTGPGGGRVPWAQCGGPFATRSAQPDGWLVEHAWPDGGEASPADTVGALAEFARTGQAAGTSGVRGGSVVPRAALAAVWSNDPAGAFAAAVEIAKITHGHPDDHLPAGFLAALLHQQVRDAPFSACLESAGAELERWPDHERTARLVGQALELSREVRSPAFPSEFEAKFPAGGVDGAEALGMAIYCAVVSDYVREALLLAVNYAQDRSTVAAISGLIIGAECGADTIPPDLRRAPSIYPVLEELANDALAEFSPASPTTPTWFQRYPGW